MSTKFENEFLAKSISKMYLDAESCDVKFKFNGDIDGETQFVPAHKAILGSESSVFYAMFFGPLKEGETIEITDASADAFKEFLQLFYLPEMEITMENIGEVIRLADKYDMLDHYDMFMGHIETQITDDNIFWVYQLAIELVDQQLKQLCENKLLLASSISNIFESDAFLQCDEHVLKNFLQLDLMFVEEIDVFNACVTWAKASCQENGLDENDPSNWKKQLGDSFYHIRFGAIAKTDIDSMMSYERYIGWFEPDELNEWLSITTDDDYKSVIFNPNFRTSTYLNKLSLANVNFFVTTIFQNAIDKPMFAATYAKLCQKLSQPGRVLAWTSKEDTFRAVFKRELLNKCQHGFNTYVANESSMRDKLKPIEQELNETVDNNRELELTKQPEKEERKLRRRSIGIVRFIGEVYRQNMLLTSIIEWCVVTLLHIGTDEKLECLCELLKIVGEKMEHKTNDEEYDKKYYRDLTSHFETMQKIASDTNQVNKISNRVRSMLKDVIELRKNKWVPRQ